MITHNLTGVLGLSDAAARQVNISPASEEASLIPETFAVT
jgi:hypothetical protein